MKIKDFSPFLDDKGEITLAERIRGTLRFGRSWFADMQSQEFIIARLENTLDDSYTLLRNLTLQDLDVPIPLILIGPPGIQVIYSSARKGIFQANGEQWRIMGSNSRRFKASNPNLLKRSILLSRAVTRHLQRCGVEPPGIESVLVFTDPGIHVDTKRPAVRIVMIDALDRYIGSLSQAEARLSQDDVQNLVKLLTHPPRDVLATSGLSNEDRRLAWAFSSEAQSQARGPARSDITVPFLGALRFTSRQWMLLGILLLVNIVVLTLVILYAVILS